MKNGIEVWGYDCYFLFLIKSIHKLEYTSYDVIKINFKNFWIFTLLVWKSIMK